MTKNTENLVLELLRSIRADVADLRSKHDETNLKIETLAGRMVSMNNAMVSMNNAIEGLRADVRMIAIAVDGHAQRLEKIEARLSIRH